MPASKLPQRVRSHQIEAESEAYTRRVLPSSWTISRMPNDYGTDLLVEVFEDQHPTGWTLEIQLKGTDAPFPRSETHRCPVKVPWLRYVLTRPSPVVLVVYFANDDRALWLWVKDYVRLRLDIENPTWDAQGSVTLHLPTSRELGGGSAGEIAGYLSSGSAASLCEAWRSLVEVAEAEREPDVLAVSPLPIGAERLAHLEAVLPVEVRQRLIRAYNTVSGAHEQRLMPRDDIETVARDLRRFTMWVGQQRAKLSQCLSNLKQLSLAALMFAQDHDDSLPEARTWCDDLEAYTRAERIWSCPATETGGYAINPLVAGMRMPRDCPEPLIFDAAVQTPTGLQAPEGRHLGLANVAFTDGHCRSMAVRDLAGLLTPGRDVP